MKEFDLCVIGSGAGGAPVALVAAQAGHSVLVLEKGPWYTEKDFFKDEIGEVRRKKFTPKAADEPHVSEEKEDGSWTATSSVDGGYDFWNGAMVGGSSNIMSGFFQRLKPEDFRLRSLFGPISGSNVADWPISYADLEPYYDKVEKVVGISGRVVPHPYQEPRSSPDFPFPPLVEHPVSELIDATGRRMGLHPLPLPRAVLSQPFNGRNMCSYSNYCGSYGCATGAKGSARAALLNTAVKTGNCEIRPNSMVRRLISDSRGNVSHVEYVDSKGTIQTISAKIFVVACQAIESARLLLMSPGERHPHGLGNRHDQVGRNLMFSAGSSVEGELPYRKLSAEFADKLRSRLPFVNRTFQDWYFYKDPKTKQRRKGGTLEVMLEHPNVIALGRYFAFSTEEKMVWGRKWKDDLRDYITRGRHLTCEVFCDWQPVDDCRVMLDPNVKDRWGLPVARVRISSHARNDEDGTFLGERAKDIFRELGLEKVSGGGAGGPSTNLQAGTCRFGHNPETSVLDPHCRVHDVQNLYVTDGSFMPTGGSVPYTWTIYANSFRVADKIVGQLS